MFLGLFLHEKEEQKMRKKTSRKISLFLSVLLLLQILLHVSGVSAASIQAPTNLTINNYYPGNVRLDWNPVPNVSTYHVYKMNDGKKELVRKVTNSRTNTSITNLEEGSYTFAVTSVSSAGESAFSNFAEVDIYYPEFLPPAELSYELKNETSVVLNWESAPYAHYYKVYEVIDGKRILKTNTTALTFTLNNVSEAIHKYEVTAYSSSMGETALAASVNVPLIDVTLEAPKLQSSLKNDTDIQLAWSAVEYATAYQIYQVIDGKQVLVAETEETEFELLDTPDGDYVYRVKAVSHQFGESADSNSVTIIIQSDRQSPVTTSNMTDEWVTNKFVVEFTATDDRSGVATTYYSINDAEFVEGTSFEVSEPGIHKVSFYSVDQAGNVEDPKTGEVKIDETAPVTISNVIDTWMNQNFTVELTATDDLSGVAKTYYSVNAAEYVKGTSFEVSEPGIHKVSFYSVDLAGNKEAPKTIEIKNDVTAPKTTSNITDAWMNENFTVNLTANDDLSGVAKTYYSINDGEYLEGTSFELSEAGVYKVKFYSMDYAGNEEEATTVEVKIDQTAPVTESNVEKGWQTQDVTVNLKANDDLSGVAKTYYSINDGEYVEGTSFEVSEEGIYKVAYYSVDSAGNVEEAKTTEVKIDQTAPMVAWKLAESRVENDATRFKDFSFGQWLANFFKEWKYDKQPNSFFSPWWFSSKSQNSITTETAVELGEELALGTVLTIDYDAADLLSGIADEEVTVNGEKIVKGDQVTLDETGEYNMQVTVTDHAGLKTTLERTFVVYIPGELEITPGSIKMNKGTFTANVSLPKGFEEDFDLSSVTLDGVPAVDKGRGSDQQASKGMFKFNSEDFDWNKGEVLAEFRGTVNGQLVIAKTTVTVK